MIKQAPVKGSDQVKVSFVLPSDRIAGKVSVVGDFNGWNPSRHPLRKRTNGTRSVSVSLPAGGRYAFRYVTDDGTWHDDDAVSEFEPNGFGGANAVLST
ncbi:MAG TPA: isoamylase early set domain-containing protein [Actinomycetes bacterium]